MTRPLRIEFCGAIYHITSRGNAKNKIFFSKRDKEEFLNVLNQAISRYNWICYTYCLMDNHYHLLIETPEGNLSEGMRHINGVYTQRFNMNHKRVGHLFQGRYKAILVQKTNYLLELSRYIVLNPVRAGIIKKAESWKWSSIRAFLEQEEMPEWLNADWILNQFGNTRENAIRRYYEFVYEGIGENVWKDLKGQIYMGDDKFIKKISIKSDLKEVPQIQQKPKRKPLKIILRKRNVEEIGEAYRKYGYKLQEIAEFLGVHYSTVSRRLKNYEEMLHCKT